ncbi:pectinesterase family protein [Streptomyces himalayensis]|uniref:Pectinesterase n=1 Tax=Streptomyces himalayensis subsp. himalayensis TaxID=2756131 RepID=A0A7W0IAR3_9ACTN|nr:pectinesterase family protein [Streptomyces himalayensis]MBA2948379.1 pectin esterase [Streptomyces himalayensis subsp. himalayensis]
MPAYHSEVTLSRRSLLIAGAGAALALGLSSPARAAGGDSALTADRPFGRYGSPAARLTDRTLYVHPDGAGDFTTVQAAVDAASGTGYTLVLAPGTYRETVNITAARAGLTLIGASEDPCDAVIVYDNAAGTPIPGGGGATYGTTGSATTTVRAADFTARWITFANDFLREEHPEISGTQAVAIKVMGDRSAFHHCRFLGHQDTLYADSLSLSLIARQYFAHCYIEGDVDFVFGRATAVYEHCRFHTLDRDVSFKPEGMVFAPSTARANPYGYLAVRCRITSGAENGAYKLSRPWVPGSDGTAWPSLVVRDTVIGPGIDAAAPYTNMRDEYPWQSQRYAEYHNTGPGAEITVPENRPQLTAEEAESATREVYLGDWTPWKAG